MAGTFKFVSFERRKDKALDASHPHPERHNLHGIGLTCTRCTTDRKVGILVDFRVEGINNTQRIIVSVQPQEDTVVIGQFKAGKHICGRRSTG